MLTVRVASHVGPTAAARATVIISALRDHPLTPHLKGTVIVGAGGAGTMRCDDERPRIIVLLADPASRGPLAAANAKRAEGVVAAEGGADRKVLASATGVVVRVTGADCPRHAFLTGTSDEECREAWAAVRGNPGLAEALGAPDRDEEDLSRDFAGRTADAVIEALVASGAVYTPPMERPAG